MARIGRNGWAPVGPDLVPPPAQRLFYQPRRTIGAKPSRAHDAPDSQAKRRK